MRLVIQFVSLLFPWLIRRRILAFCFGYEIAPSARIGVSLVLPTTLKMAAGSSIGHLTLAKGLASMCLGEKSSIGNLNWITGMPASNKLYYVKFTLRKPSLILERESSLTHRHLIDCTDEVRIGAYTTIAGWGTQILTHSIDVNANEQSCSPVHIGDYCFIGTRCIILKGAHLPDKSVLAAGSTLSTKENHEYGLYSGVRAEYVKKLDPGMKYFCRSSGRVF